VVEPTVPDVMFGCWRRAWIEYADGTRDESGTVVWLQTESAMVDVRIPVDRHAPRDLTGFEECTFDDLVSIASSDASSGFTECTPAIVGADGTRSATATWHTRGHGINFHPISAFPEPGWMTWNDDGTVMTECAPSGAYAEEWRLVPSSRDHMAMSVAGDTITYVAGDVAVLVRDRRIPIPRPARLDDLLREHHDDRPFVEALLDCEFSVAELSGDRWTITASTLPWREGQVVDVDR
jgi:hypothetical protein